MKRSVLVFILMSLVQPAAALGESRFVTVQGEGRVAAAPDMAVVSVGVVHQARTARAAMDAVAQDARKVIEAMAVFGVGDSDIQTSGLSLHPVHDHRNNSGQRPEIIGFSASNQLSLKVRDLPRIGELLDALVDAGANNLGGISFRIADPAAAMDRARQAAVADALARAQLYAEAASVQLGDVLEISENSVTSPARGMIRMEAMAADSIPIQPGKIDLLVQIWIKVALK